ASRTGTYSRSRRNTPCAPPPAHTGCRLLSYAKPAKNAIQEIVGENSAGHLAELIERAAHLKGQQLRRLLMHDQRMRRSQMLQATVDMVPASTQARRQARPQLAARSVSQDIAKFVQALASNRTRGQESRRCGGQVAFGSHGQHRRRLVFAQYRFLGGS